LNLLSLRDYCKERSNLAENSFQFNGENYLQIHETAMDTKMAVAIANIFMAKVETEILDDIYLWDTTREEIT